MKKFYITGVSGTGKSSVALKLKEKGISVIDIDEVKGLCHWVHESTKEIHDWYSGIGSDFLDLHDYICDQEKLIKLINECKDIVVVFGLAGNQSEFLNLFDKVFLFHCDEKIFLERIRTRTNHDFGKHESEKKMILGWYRDLEKEMLEEGAIPINTDRPLVDVVDEVMSKF